MHHRVLRSTSGVLLIAFAAAPGAASVVTRPAAPAFTLSSTNTTARSSASSLFRVVRSAASNAFLKISRPSGCEKNGSLSFFGEPGNSTYGFNFAGGGKYGTVAGVVADGGNEACDASSIIGAGEKNTVGGDGTSYESGVFAGELNVIEAGDSFIGAGQNNVIGQSAGLDNLITNAIVAGNSNTISAYSSFIGAGLENTITPAAVSGFVGDNAFIGAGYANSVAGNYAAIVGGNTNSVSADAASIGGGANNLIGAEYGVIGGGWSNVVSGIQAVVSGGYGNRASGKDATFPGGTTNAASGANSFAAGTKSLASNTGAFVWSDDATGATTLESTAADQFLARASGGFFLYSSKDLKSGVMLTPGSGSWSTLSDRNAKTDIRDIDDARILAKLETLPISEWSYSEQGTGVRHLGPMAQDFHAAFGLGEDDRHISTVDEEGIALAAIKALQTENASLCADRDADEARLTRLEARLDAMDARSTSKSDHASSDLR